MRTLAVTKHSPDHGRSTAQVQAQAFGERLVDGASFILDAPEHVPAVWGSGEEVLWSQGEPCILAGPAGVGKTTLAQQLALARCGVAADLDLLGHPVTPDPDRFVLYIAADRPRQAARSFRRMITPNERRSLERGLLVWGGPPPVGLASNPAEFAAWLQVRGVGTVILDSLKDFAVGLADDAIGSAVNSALQTVVSVGIEVLVLHHQRKATGDNKRPAKLADVYGSTWLTAGAGSVLLLWGDPGDSVVELTHLKQPADDAGPLTVTHDHATGRSHAARRVGVRQLVGQATDGGITVKDAARGLFAVAEPTANQIEKARRKLEQLVPEHAVKVEGGPGESVVYRPVSVTHRDPQRDPPTPTSRKVTNPDDNGSREGHAPSREGSGARPPYYVGGGAETVTPTEQDEIDAELERVASKFPDLLDDPEARP